MTYINIQNALAEKQYDGQTFSQWQRSPETELMSERQEETLTAIGKLGAFGRQKEVFETVFNFVESNKVRSNSDVFTAALNALGAIRGEAEFVLLMQALNSDNMHRQILAAAMVSNFKPTIDSPTTTVILNRSDELAPRLIELSTAEDAEVRWLAFSAMVIFAKTHHKEVEAAMRAGLSDESARTRVELVSLWSETDFDPTLIVPAIIDCVNYGHQSVADQAITYYGSKLKGISRLLTDSLLEDSNFEDSTVFNRSVAILQLIQILGPNAADVEEDLNRLYNDDKYERIRHPIKNALSAILRK